MMLAGISRDELEALYADYADAADNDLARWPQLFTERCLYRVVSRENYELGLPLSTMSAESRGMLLDRVVAIDRINVHKPRTMRHLYSALRILDESVDGTRVASHFAIFESPHGGTTTIFAAGRSFDIVVREDGTLRFREKVCVYDGDLVSGSLIYPF